VFQDDIGAVFLLIISLCVWQGKFKAAKEAYEQLVECPDIPSMLKANALRQLGQLLVFVLYCSH